MSHRDVYGLHRLPPDSKCIRVLDILPATPDTNTEPIRCALRVIDLDDRPQFTALSYVWGKDPPTPQYFIECGEAKLQVTANCRSALRHLREKLGGLTIWVDAVCINQNDSVEKSQQIPLMSDIYRIATFVYVWLGEGTPETDRAMRYLAMRGVEQYFSESRRFAAAWSLHSARWSWTRNPLPIRGRQDTVRRRERDVSS